MARALTQLKVALVHDFLTTMGGAERVTQALSEIFPQAPICTLLYHPRVGQYFPGKKIIVSSLQRWHRNLRIPTKYLFPFMPQAIESFDLSGYDLVISSNNSFAGGIITDPNTFHLSYCHSPTRYLWDATHTYVDEQRLPVWVKNIVRAQLSDLRIWDRLAAGRVQRYIANSHNVERRIRKYYRRDADVIYPPVDTHKIKPKSGNSGYFLVVSRLVSYKRIDLAIKACNVLKLPLLIIGEGEHRSVLERLAGPTVEFLGWQEDKSKIEYLRNSRALIFPGEEDFGIVPVEAMAAGKPVIAFNKGGVTESIKAGVTGIFFDESSTQSLVSALRRFMALERKLNYREISQYAGRFSRERFKEEIMTVVTKVLSA
ncbi:hypothetical protein A2V68_02875 [candidate division Kazan bacterium RBG_13_50_9]|uniref:Glycosyl transferase family 1 domain-containing protein n=1 Tax=candidate division Kazan bacterium RBG_13_50_9 TaxID=1798535 RepID=A0A1F4NT95_UNCK3|nr:MAG: hypothetical protein A2V68_02875 [candidate division Kazan bacterium RBG_13_50_9]